MERVLKFVQDPDLRWYVDLPEWEGTRADLEMVAGADIMLNILTQGKQSITLKVSNSEFENATPLKKTRDNEEFGGAWYYLASHQGINYEKEIWLCAVLDFVFMGTLPPWIYFQVVNG